jgi:rhodanese-related sulfurtransferase
MTQEFAAIHSLDVRQALLERREIALLDVREEDPHAHGHPLFAANLPASRIEADAYARLPRRDVPIVVLDDDGGDEGDSEARTAARRLAGLGYTDVRLLAGGLAGWQKAGGEVFIDVNVPSKAFGEFVEANQHTPSLAAAEIKALLDAGANAVVVDTRRYDEYRNMSIPTGISVPGAELVLRVPELAPDPDTLVVVNCAGRTRSIIGTQSLINAGLPNRVVALRNGTMGWTLAGLELDSGQSRRFPPVGEAGRRRSARTARAVADRAGVRRADRASWREWAEQHGRTTYFFDVRTPEEYAAGHLPGFAPAAGGQLVQETEMFAPVRGARIVLADDDGARANMTASWLAQMDWEVYVLDGLKADDFAEAGPWLAPLPPPPASRRVSPRELHAWLQSGGSDGPDAAETVVVDVGGSADYAREHVQGAWFALRSRLAEALARIPRARRYVLTCGDGLLAAFAAPELAARVEGEVYVLDGGTRGWREAGLPLEAGLARPASPPIDRYQRPYEGVNAPAAAMQAYLDWELGLVEQLRRDGTHHFRVLPAAAHQRFE